MSHSLKSADGGTHIKIVAVSLVVSSIWILALSAMHLHDISVSEIASKPFVYAAVRAPAEARMVEATISVGWTGDVWRPDTTATRRQ